MRWPSSRQWALLSVPTSGLVLLFLLQAFAIAEHRVDYPVVDDWRYYIPGFAMPGTLTLDWIFAPARDTVHATGKLIDWLVFRFIAHDYRVLSVLSFVLFAGGWLLCSLRLAAVTSGSRPLALFASLLVFCVPLAGSPYWVTASRLQRLEPLIAYHQMLPVLGLTALALLCTTDSTRWRRGAAPVLAALLTLVFALTYNSGALALFVFGAAALVLGALCRRKGVEVPASLTAVAWAVAGVGAACLALHILMPMWKFGLNPVVDVRTARFSYALPTEPEFWWYFLGLFDRAVGGTTVGWTADLRGMTLAAIFVVPAMGLSVLLVRGEIPLAYRRRAIVLIALLAAILAYAALVSYGRANFGHRYVRALGQEGVALYARHRFFFWWVAASLPFAVIAWSVLVERLLSRRASTAVAFALMLGMMWPKASHQDRFPTYLQQWDYRALYQRDAKRLTRRLRIDVQKAEAGEASTPMVRDAAGGPKSIYEYAREVGATFVDRHGLLSRPERQED